MEGVSWSGRLIAGLEVALTTAVAVAQLIESGFIR
jgi:hypothetical protein